QAAMDFVGNAGGVIKHFINDRMKSWTKGMPGGPLASNILGNVKLFAKPLVWIKDKAIGLAKKLSPPSSGAVNGNLQAYVKGQMARYGWGPDQWPALRKLVQNEAG